MRSVVVVGSTGSIGRQALQVIAEHPGRLSLFGVAARSRVEALTEQAAQYAPRLIAVWDEQGAVALSRLVGGRRVLAGMEGLIRLVTHPEVDVVVVAASGHEALVPVLEAITAGKQIALASKELLVMAGELIMSRVRERGVRLVPVDSEHAALFQCLQGVDPEEVSRLVITGSGGPLWAHPVQDRVTVTREQVLAHPKWRMGPKITVDSATLMNKGLEVMEARWLFDVPVERIEVVVHPEAVVHGLVELMDGTWMAQMSPCDMRLPIQAALSFPERWNSPPARLSFGQLADLHFFTPEVDQFPCLRMALEAARRGGSTCVVLNAANDVAVHAYLNERIAFGDIPRVIAGVLERHDPIPHLSLNDILSVDAAARQAARECLP